LHYIAEQLPITAKAAKTSCFAAARNARPQRGLAKNRPLEAPSQFRLIENSGFPCNALRNRGLGQLSLLSCVITIGTPLLTELAIFLPYRGSRVPPAPRGRGGLK
jgi:hypothetical protein